MAEGGSEQDRGETLPPLDSTRVVGAHNFQKIEVALSSLVVIPRLLQQGGKFDFEVADGVNPGHGGDPSGLGRLGHPIEQDGRLGAVTVPIPLDQ